MRKPFICGNWKMNTDRAGAVVLVAGTAKAACEVRGVEVGVAPPACYLEAVLAVVPSTPLVVAAQNMHFEAGGAFTGEVAGPMLKDLGCRYVILGHSERRHIFGETDEFISKKVHAAFKFGLLPILCVGETIEERKAGQTEDIVERHVTMGFAGLSKAQARRGRHRVRAGLGHRHGPDGHARAGPGGARVHPASPRNTLRRGPGRGRADPVRRQRQARQHVRPHEQADIDGALVGGASLKADGFTKIIKEGARRKGA